METTSLETNERGGLLQRIRNAPLISFGRRLLRDKTAVTGLVIVAATIVLSLLAPVLSPYDPIQWSNPALRLAPPGTEGHLLGLDGQGRDLMTRILHGASTSVLIGVLPVVFAFLVAMPLGVLSGYYRGILDYLVMRTMDVVFAFPMILLGVAIGAVLGPGIDNLLITLTIVFIPYLTRVVYRSTIEVSEKEFITASRACGLRDVEILKEIVPNVLPEALVYCTTNIGLMIVFGSGLSFLGLGVQSPNPEWGLMVKKGMDALVIAPHASTLPGVAILVVAIGFNFLGDGIRDAIDLNPELR